MTYHSKSSTDEAYLPEDQTRYLLKECVCVCVCERVRACTRACLCLRIKWRYPKRPYQNVPSINKIKGQVQCVPAKLLQLHSTLDPVVCSAPGSSVHGILQAGILSGLPFPSPRYLSSPGIEPKPLVSPALAGGFFATSTTWEAHQVQDFYSILLHINFSVFLL